MEIQQLKYFVALVRELHFKKAAERMGVTQPTLSMQFKKLEEELGYNLLERSHHQIRLTSEGEVFFPHAVKILDMIDEAVDSLHQQKDLSGRIRIAFIPTIGPYLIADLIKYLKKEAPLLKLDIFEDTTSDLMENLKKGKYDLGVLALPLEYPGIVTKILGQENFLLAFSKKHKFSKKKLIEVKDLQDQDLLMLQEGHCFRSQALEFCSKSNSDMNVVFEGSSLVSVMNMVGANMGLTFVPEMAACQKSYPQLLFKKFKNPQPQRQIGAVWRMSYGLRYVEKYLLEVFSKILVKK